jgi:hypothetical protein
MRGQLQEIEPPERYEVVSDILQEVWLRIFHNVSRFDPEKKFIQLVIYDGNESCTQ